MATIKAAFEIGSLLEVSIVNYLLNATFILHFISVSLKTPTVRSCAARYKIVSSTDWHKLIFLK